MEVEESEEIIILAIKGAGIQPGLHAGISESGDVYLPGDIHPLGSASALLTAARHHVPYVAVSAVQVLYPSDWLRAECMHDMDRLRVIGNMEELVRKGDAKHGRP